MAFSCVFVRLCKEFKSPSSLAIFFAWFASFKIYSEAVFEPEGPSLHEDSPMIFDFAWTRFVKISTCFSSVWILKGNDTKLKSVKRYYLNRILKNNVSCYAGHGDRSVPIVTGQMNAISDQSTPWYLPAQLQHIAVDAEMHAVIITQLNLVIS